MIIKKNEDGSYVCEASGGYFNIPKKEFYLAQKEEIESVLEPSIEELLELAKQQHPYYQRENALININNTLQEIEEFENQ